MTDGQEEPSMKELIQWLETNRTTKYTTPAENNAYRQSQLDTIKYLKGHTGNIGEVREKFEHLRNSYRVNLKGKTRGADTEWANFFKKNPKATVEFIQEIFNGAENMYKEKLKEYPDGKFEYIPNFQTFINQSKWEEYLQE